MGQGRSDGRKRRGSDEAIWAAVEDELARTRKKYRRDMCGVRRGEAVHPVFRDEVVIETRTGTGTSVRVVSRKGAFKGSDGVIRQTSSQCNPAIHRCTDGFYGQIDRDLREWQQEEDAKLRVPYAVRERRRRRAEWKMVKADALARGIA